MKLALTLATICLGIFSRMGGGLERVWAAAQRRLVERGTPMSDLMHENPARLDIRLLETTPVDAFDVMGETLFEVNLEEWRLVVEGAVHRPAAFSYAELTARAALERNVLLICPGFFAYNGLWKGFSVAALLSELGLADGGTHVKFSGSSGFRRKSRRYPIAEVMQDKIFIAYAVNGQTLPERHGFPMRLVAEDHKGREWVKYLNTLTVIAK